MFAVGPSPALIGVVHLLPLPGAPRPSPGLAAVIERAVSDARALVEGGADAAIIENLGDAPFVAEAVEPWTVAAMTRVALAIRQAAPKLPLGLNVLRNDASAALGVAAAVDATFIRVNVHTGMMWTDQGPIVGRARETLLARSRLGADVRIAADVLVKHAEPAGSPDIRDVARDTMLRGGADAVIVSGTGTGRPTAPGRVEAVLQAARGAPVWVGSGVQPDNLPPAGLAAAVVGTWLHESADLDRPLDPRRVNQVAEALQTVR